MSEPQPIPEMNDALKRINAALAQLKDARRIGVYPQGVYPSQVDGVIHGLELGKALLLNDVGEKS